MEYSGRILIRAPSYVIKEFLIAFLVNDTSYGQCHRAVDKKQPMERRGRQMPVDYRDPYVFDVAVDRIEQEHPLHPCRECIDVVKDRRHVHEQHHEHIIQILGIPEKHEQGRQDHPDSNIEHRQGDDRINDSEHAEAERHSIDRNEHKEHHKRKAKIDYRRNVLTENEQILRHIDLRKNVRIAHQRLHPAGSRLPEIGEDQVPGKQICRIKRNAVPEKLRKDQFHDQQRQKRAENAPGHPQDRALVFLFKVTLDQLLKEELVAFNQFNNFFCGHPLSHFLYCCSIEKRLYDFIPCLNP